MIFPLLATDLDGTLLNDEKEIASETLEAINDFRRNGGRIVICSGRSPLSTKWIASTIGLEGEPIIAYNGAVLLDEMGKVIEQAFFQPETVLSLYELCHSKGIYAHLYEGDTLLIPMENKWNKNWIENNIPELQKSGGDLKSCKEYRKACKVKIINNFFQYIKENQPLISKIALLDDTGRLREFSKYIENNLQDIEVFSSLNYLNLEISPKGVTKASALLKLTERLQIPITQTAAIGDNYNDSTMLSTVGLGIAMGNAPEEVKQLADKITKNNNDAGVAYAIRTYLFS
jgi:Cof subfamily protein (haloacid dehalogenase superfamily)